MQRNVIWPMARVETQYLHECVYMMYASECKLWELYDRHHKSVMSVNLVCITYWYCVRR